MTVVPIRGSGITNRGNTPIDLAKDVASRLCWYLDGITVVDKNGDKVADNLFAASSAMVRLGWINVHTGEIMWKRFPSSKCNPAEIVRSELGIF